MSMMERRCKWCNKMLTPDDLNRGRVLCSAECRFQYKTHCYTADDGPTMPPLDTTRITDEGYVELVKAIVEQAKDDILHGSPGTMRRVDAEEFFMSDFFGKLTGLDGELILQRILAGRKKKKKKRNEM